MVTKLDLRQDFIAFRDECIWLRNCYNTFAALFESGDETQRVLRETAGLFFDDLHRILMEYTFLQGCKITDPPESRGRGNLTVKSLNDSLEAEGILTDEIREISKSILLYRDCLKSVRDRRISHLDKEAVLSGQPTGAHKSGDVTAFFENLQAYCDGVGNAVGVGPLDFRCSPGKGDVIDLIAVLRRVCDASPSED
jgi:hypothetical protein